MTSAKVPSDSSSRLRLMKSLTAEYQDLNGRYVETLEQTPSALEFLRLIHIGRPVIIKGLYTSAHEKWTDEYLTKTMADRKVSVAVTPDGHADAIERGRDGRLYFVEPYVEKLTIQELLDKLAPDPKSGSENVQDVYYLQSQNGNLFKELSLSGESNDCSEFEPLLQDTPRGIAWATEALGSSPDAVNIWIGDGRSVTSVHSDPYENIYTVVRGAKHFTLLPPTEGWCLRERLYPHAQYQRQHSGGPLIVTPSPASTPSIRWSSVRDPLDMAALPPEADPFHITLREGETLYLPAGWWHHVRQTDITIALNWWYDMEMRGMSWVWQNFLRGSNDDVPDGNAGQAV